MKSKNLRLLVIISGVLLIMLLFNEYFWVNKSIELQNEQVEIQADQIRILNTQFDDKVTIALTNVRDRLLSLNKDTENLRLDPVKKINRNYFVVSIVDTISSDLLQSYLIQEFSEANILEGFEYGVYDCFEDSIIYDKYVSLSKDIVREEGLTAPQFKWDYDGHYFGVFFPNRKTIVTNEPIDNVSWTMWASTLILSLFIGVFSYSLFIILKQKKLSEIKTDFINNMTHELKTPISTISLSSEMLLKDKVQENKERIGQYANIIYNENTRLKNQVERVLQLATLNKGEVELKKKELNIHQLLTTCMSVNKLKLDEKNGEIVLNLNANNFNFYGDNVHISNIFFNLIDNAIKYCKVQPKIFITTRNKVGGIEIEIKDNGIGILKEDIKHIFEQFYRVPTGNVHNVKGFGLGLYYVNQMIKAHSGKISVDSKFGEGTTFTIFLPQ